MNRHERRARDAQRPKTGTSIVPTFLDLHCAGPFSEPKTDCDLRALVPLPFDIEELRSHLATGGWFVTLSSPPGQSMIAVTALCGACAERILDPALLRAAKRIIPGSA